MPSPFLQKLAKETNKKEKDLEKFWNQAKAIAVDSFGKPEEKFTSKEYAFVATTTKRLAGIREAIDINEFLESELSADEFLEAMISSTFSAQLDKTAIVPPKKDEEDEEKRSKKDIRPTGKLNQKGKHEVAIHSSDPVVVAEAKPKLEVDTSLNEKELSLFDALLDDRLE